MLRIIVAPDSFKEGLTSIQAAEAIARGARAAASAIQVEAVPMADGGEGTVETLVQITDGQIRTVTVTGPLGEPVEAAFGVLGDGRTAVIEMAAASGLHLVPPRKRNPMLTTTCGTGELIAAALDAGVRRIILGIGGSATCDAGAGAAQALGVHLLDAEGREIARGGGALERLSRIDLRHRDPRLAATEIIVACDVTNPLTGPRGAAPVFGPQKGATAKMVQQLAHNLVRFADVVGRDMDLRVADVPGAGAAGGLGAGAMALLGATLKSGVEIVIEAVGLEKRLAGADLCLTAEGRADAQSLMGKTVAGVARAAARANVPVIVLAGQLGEGYRELNAGGVAACFAIPDRPMSLEEAMANAPDLLAAAAEQVTRAFLAGRR
jgi:glycerate kinase